MIWAGTITPVHCGPRMSGTTTGAETQMRTLAGMVSRAATAVAAR